MDNSRTSLEAALAAYGLRLRGGWIPTPADTLPALPGGSAPAAVWMVGQVGSEAWPVFSASAFARDGMPDPMDRWSRSIGERLAAERAGVVLHPSDGPPWHPFQRWAARAEPLQPSPLMLQIHPAYGLWHAWRFALAVPDLLAQDAARLQEPAPAAADLCLRCDGQPCLSACPVDAFTTHGYDVQRCGGFLHGSQGEDCMQRGCQARRACPVGVEHRYTPQHAGFHMRAFAARH